MNGKHSIQLSWHGGVHNPYVYFEPVAEMLKVKIWPLFYYCNNIHETISAFSLWWKSVCTPPQHSLQPNHLIYVQNVDKYITVCAYCM